MSGILAAREHCCMHHIHDRYPGLLCTWLLAPSEQWCMCTIVLHAEQHCVAGLVPPGCVELLQLAACIALMGGGASLPPHLCDTLELLQGVAACPACV